ncbi:MAG: hypothetical protein P8M13_06300 [Luminiphilus sp.]|nr:hypothetical protein [Luminiphilus sp.]
MRLLIAIAKWSIIAVLWTASVAFVTSSAFVMNATSSVMSEWGITTIHHVQQAKICRLEEEICQLKNYNANSHVKCVRLCP